MSEHDGKLSVHEAAMLMLTGSTGRAEFYARRAEKEKMALEWEDLATIYRRRKCGCPTIVLSVGPHGNLVGHCRCELAELDRYEREGRGP